MKPKFKLYECTGKAAGASIYSAGGKPDGQRRTVKYAKRLQITGMQ
ncbi:MAG: hypothetical protein IKO64_00195 [Kiritimatiellae bacterium]|nr:hypothetical protein [Kiritimatiellia bacterium]